MSILAHVLFLIRRDFLKVLVVALSISRILFSPTSATAQAVENPLDTDINFRGQGRANLCYAFAEEQMLKDFTCDRNCDYNADQWDFSIFDIARAHQLKWIQWIQRYPDSITSDLNIDLLSNGSAFYFPYNDVNVQSFRKSTCTLEREVFLLNRSRLTNPDRLEIGEYLADFWAKVKSTRQAILPPQFKPIESGWRALISLAQNSADKNEFLSQVINYTSCNDRVSLPRFHVDPQTPETFNDIQSVSERIEALIMHHKSLYVGVCAEVLQDERWGSPDYCGRHAVVLRRVRQACPAKSCGLEIQVVDSAFFSKRPRNVDGSYWIPENVVAQAILKSQRDFTRIMNKAKIKVAALKNDRALSRIVEDTYLPIIQKLRLKMMDVAAAEFNAKTIIALKDAINLTGETSGQTLALDRRIVARAESLKFERVSDLDQLIPVFISELTPYLRDGLTYITAIEAQISNNLVWLESQ